MIDPKKLAEWRALCEKATPGPWLEDPCNEMESTGIVDIEVSGGFQQVCDTVVENTWSAEQCRGNARFIAAAREALPALLDAYENLHRQFDGMRGERDAEREISKQWEEKYAALQVDHCAEVAQWRDWCETIEGRVEAAAQADGASLREENERLREQLRLANLDALTAHLDADKG